MSGPLTGRSAAGWQRWLAVLSVCRKSGMLAAVLLEQHLGGACVARTRASGRGAKHLGARLFERYIGTPPAMFVCGQRKHLLGCAERGWSVQHQPCHGQVQLGGVGGGLCAR